MWVCVHGPETVNEACRNMLFFILRVLPQRSLAMHTACTQYIIVSRHDENAPAPKLLLTKLQLRNQHCQARLSRTPR